MYGPCHITRVFGVLDLGREAVACHDAYEAASSARTADIVVEERADRVLSVTSDPAPP